jgi:hypothetical protein
MACTDKAAQPGGDMLKVAVWGRVLDRWWPAALPFPPAAPWLAGQVSRKSAKRFIRTHSREIPNLPASPTDAQVGEALTALALKVSVPDDVRALGGSSGGCQSLSDQRQCECTADDECATYGWTTLDVDVTETGDCSFTCYGPDPTNPSRSDEWGPFTLPQRSCY